MRQWHLLDDQRGKSRENVSQQQKDYVPENEYLIQISMDKDLKICN